jgi:hypothetical protein
MKANRVTSTIVMLNLSNFTLPPQSGFLCLNSTHDHRSNKVAHRSSAWWDFSWGREGGSSSARMTHPCDETAP